MASFTTYCARDRGPYEEKNARQQKRSMRDGKHDRAPGNTNSHQQVGSVLKFLANFQKRGSDKAKEKNRKICGSISLFVNVTIPGTHVTTLSASNNDLHFKND
jgi:hypothetical protein